MASLSLNCPRCGAQNSSINLLMSIPLNKRSDRHHVIGRCASCMDDCLLTLHNTSGSTTSPIDYGESHPVRNGFSVIEILPSSGQSEVPEFLPANVMTILVEGEKCFSSKHFSAAASCYRKAMERSLRHLNPSETGMLNKRIRALEKGGLIPNALVELLDHVRLFGNEAMHDDDIDPTHEDIQTAREFAHLFLTYTFALPEKLRLASKNREL